MEAGFIPAGTAGAGASAPPHTVVAPSVNVIRAPGLKRGKMEEAISDRVSFSFFVASHCILHITGWEVGTSGFTLSSPVTIRVSRHYQCMIVTFLRMGVEYTTVAYTVTFHCTTTVFGSFCFR